MSFSKMTRQRGTVLEGADARPSYKTKQRVFVNQTGKETKICLFLLLRNPRNPRFRRNPSTKFEIPVLGKKVNLFQIKTVACPSELGPSKGVGSFMVQATVVEHIFMI